MHSSQHKKLLKIQVLFREHLVSQTFQKYPKLYTLTDIQDGPHKDFKERERQQLRGQLLYLEPQERDLEIKEFLQFNVRFCKTIGSCSGLLLSPFTMAHSDNMHILPWEHWGQCYKALMGENLGFPKIQKLEKVSFDARTNIVDQVLTTYLPTYLSTYLPTYLPIYLTTYLCTYLSTNLSFKNEKRNQCFFDKNKL